MADNLPRKGDAVQVLMNEYIRRGETGYILNVKTVNEGTNAERQLALVKFDKSGIVDWLPFKQEATAYTEVLPALTRVKTRAVKFMDVEAVKTNKVALLAYAETELELRKEYRAARIVQNAFRSRRAKSRTSVRREKVRKMTEFRIKVYKTGLRLLCFADNAWMRSVLIKQKVIRAKYLPEHMYPESSLQPKWYKEMMLKRKKRRSKAAEIPTSPLIHAEDQTPSVSPHSVGHLPRQRYACGLDFLPLTRRRTARLETRKVETPRIE